MPCVGTLAPGAAAALAAEQPGEPTTADGSDAIDLGGMLQSPFPHGRLAVHGLEALRFQWANAAALTAAGSGARENFRQKSGLQPLDVGRDWIDCCEDVGTYAAEMQLRHDILTSVSFCSCTMIVLLGQKTPGR